MHSFKTDFTQEFVNHVEIDLLQCSGDYTRMMGAPGYPREDMIRLIMNEVNMECSPYVLFMNRHQK